MCSFITNSINKTDSGTPLIETCVHRKLEQCANNFPENTAICFENNRLNYKNLNSASNALAHLLLSKGLGIEDFVIVFLDRSIELMVSIYGILKAGGVYVPVSSHIPKKRIESIIKDTEPKFILTVKNKETNLPGSKTEVIYLDDFLDNYASHNLSNPTVNVRPDNLAYAIFTSGTTGKPKGVLIEHRSVINRIEWMQKEYPISQTDVLLQKTTITFDVSIWELFWPSFTGANLILLPPEEEKEPQKIAGIIEKEKISVIHFVPSMFNTFLNYINSHKTINYLESLKWVFCSGEALLSKHINDFYNYNGTWENDAVLANLYGPTEATVDVTYYTCLPNNKGPVPIGRPIEHTNIYIVNEKNEALPANQEGELIICGVNLARGYLKREELTKEKFIHININGQAERGYKTGDIGYYDSNGFLFYNGRMDSQVKLRGFRIELSEIENTLISIQGIKNSAAVIKDESYENAHLVCFYISEDGVDMDDRILKQTLTEKLPDYMVPSVFHRVDDFPLSSSGKLDRKKLLKNLDDYHGMQAKKSLSEYEKILQAIWGKLFRKEGISPVANFFDIGGNSLMILQLAMSIQQELNIDIDVLTIMQYPTIQSLANYFSDFND